jgi:integrase/recombinase XerD
LTATQVIDLQANMISPPKLRVILASATSKKAHCFQTGHLENTMAAAKSLTTAELAQALAYIETQPYALRNRVMLIMTVAAGLRVSEVAGLTLGDVLDSTGEVRAEVYLAAHRVKHGNARTIYINSRLRQELTDYISTRSSKDASLPLFPTHRGPRRHFSPNTLSQHFHWMYKRAGIRGASSHSGRKTFLTRLASQGVSVFVLASLAGHKCISTTQRYITVNDEVKRRAVELA